MQWKGLEPLGVRFLDFAKRIYRDPLTLCFAIENEVDARDVLHDAFGGCDLGALGDEGVNILLKWKQSMSRFCSLELNMRCNESFNHIHHPGTCQGRSIQVEFEEIVKESPSYVLDLAKRQLKRKCEEKGTQRADLEREQRTVYALQLAELLKEACLPVTFQIELLQDPNRAWVRIFGSRRSKTLRNRLRAWQKFRSWFIALSGEVWPKSLAPLVAYVEEQIDDGCTYSCPSELHASLTILEQIGRVPDEKKISNDTMWMSHLASWKLELETNSRPPRAAKPYAVAILVSLEIFILDFEQDVYCRFVAWVMLIACWASMRVDDIQNNLPETLRVSKRGLTAKLSRSKTSGPGKLHGQLAIFVHRSVSLTGLDWIGAGKDITLMDSFIYPRDYLVPFHSDSWGGFYPKLVEPPALANFFRIVLGKLGTPKYQDGAWRTNNAMLLVPGDLLLFWTGHSPRHFLNQAALSLGVPKERRDYLGRWAIGRTGSNAYIHTSRQVVESMQLEVVKALTTGSAEIDETELLEEITQFADTHGLVGHRVRRRHTQQLDRQIAPLQALESESEVEIEEDSGTHQQPEVCEPVEVQPTGQSARFFVTVSRRTGLRRLHAHNRCPVKSQRCLETFDLNHVEENAFDVMCKICKCRLQSEQGRQDSDSSSSSGDSSSTDSEAPPSGLEEPM
eukprot:s408_g29.t1